jgi:hypothetical protein
MVVAASLASVGNVQGMVDDAHSFAMEAAVPFVEKGFKVRSDYWNGELKSGERKAVKHQLFKGNEYCFWLGVDSDDVKITIGIFDLKGNAVEVQVTESTNAKSVRILPPTTGSYLIVFAVQRVGEAVPATEPVGWALAYGYR